MPAVDPQRNTYKQSTREVQRARSRSAVYLRRNTINSEPESRYWEISFLPHHTRSLWVALASCSPQNEFQDCYYHFQGSPVPAAILSRRPYSTVLCQHDHCDLLHCHFVFLLEKPKWPSPNHFHLLPRVFGISSQVIFHPFPLFLLSGRNSSTIFFWLPFPVIPHHPLASRFVMSAYPQMPLRSDTPHRLANTFQLSAYE